MAVIPEQEAVERHLRMARGCLIKARSLLDVKDPQELDHRVPELDSHLRDAFHLLEDCRRYLTLYREPEYEEYDLAKIVRKGAEQPGPLFNIDPNKPCFVEGDPEQTMGCLRLIRDSARLTAGQSLSADLYREESLPYIVVRAAGGFELPEVFAIRPGLDVSRVALAERWAAATRGGEIEFIPDGLLLGLNGPLPAPESSEALTRLVTPVRRAGEILRAWRGASGLYEPGYASLEDVARLYEKAVTEALGCIDQALAP